MMIFEFVAIAAVVIVVIIMLTEFIKKRGETEYN